MPLRPQSYVSSLVSLCIPLQPSAPGYSSFPGFTFLPLWLWSCSSLNLKIQQIFTTKNLSHQTVLVVQWLRICLPMKGTWVRAPVWEDPTCHGATKPVSHNYWACTLELGSHNYWARAPQLRKSVRLEPVLRSKRSHLNEKPVHCDEE